MVALRESDAGFCAAQLVDLCRVQVLGCSSLQGVGVLLRLWGFSFLNHANSSIGRVVLFVCTWCWRPHGSSGVFGFALLLLLEDVGELVEQTAVSQGVSCSLASPAIFEAVDRAGSFELFSGRELAGAGVSFPPRDLESLRVVL